MAGTVLGAAQCPWSGLCAQGHSKVANVDDITLFTNTVREGS